MTEEKKNVGGALYQGIKEDMNRQIANLKKPGSPVYDKDGKEIGRTGIDHFEATLQDGANVIGAALRGEDERKMVDVGLMLNKLASIANLRREAIPVADWRVFSSRLEANKALAELEGEYKKQSHEIDVAIGLIPQAPEYVDFKKAVAEQRRAIQDAWDLKV
jgi:hypothetical protein